MLSEWVAAAAVLQMEGREGEDPTWRECKLLWALRPARTAVSVAGTEETAM